MRALKTFGLSLAAVLCVAQGADAQELRHGDRVRMAEAFRLAESVHNLWPGWEETPFSILLVTDEYEYLVGYPDPGPDFTSLGNDPIIGRAVYRRASRFQPNLLATFPALGGDPVVVVGSPEHTQKTSSAWVITLLHEHFHQYQMSQPDYYASVDALELSGGDQSGQWMLNYPFPYDSEAARELIRDVRTKSQTLLHQSEGAVFRQHLPSYVAAWEELRRGLDPADYRYLVFQSWQEGVARYTELQVADRATRYEPSNEFLQLPDYEPFSAVLGRIMQDLTTELSDLPLVDGRRLVFYSIGAAQALILDRARPGWRDSYLKNAFDLSGSVSERIAN